MQDASAVCGRRRRSPRIPRATGSPRAWRPGMAPDAICVDPGIGFGKRPEHNLELLREPAHVLDARGQPLLVGVSRKSLIGMITGRPPVSGSRAAWRSQRCAWSGAPRSSARTTWRRPSTQSGSRTRSDEFGRRPRGRSSEERIGADDDAQEILRNRRRARARRRAPHDRRIRPAPRERRGTRARAGRGQRARRQGHAAFRLHVRGRPRGRLRRRRRRRAA